MTEEEYRNSPAVNKSTLWELHRSPAHYRYLLEHPRDDTSAMKMGRAVHKAILQPRTFKKEFAVIPQDIDRRTKAGKEAYTAFEKENAGKDLLTADEMLTVQAIKRAVSGNSEASALLKGTKKEQALFWTDPATGIECKCRYDAAKKGVCIDLKTTTDASTYAFLREALKRGYDVQAAHYLRGLKAVYGWEHADFYLIAVEKDPPFAVNVLKCSDGFIDRGTWQLMDLLEKLKTCRDSGTWPDYGTNELILPTWAELGDDE